MVKLFASSGDPDHMPHSASSDLGLHCLSVTRLGASSLKWAKREAFAPKETYSVI